MEFSITARDAEDIARELNNDSGAGSFYGVFVAAGCEPTEADLDRPRRVYPQLRGKPAFST
jgi:hypothetical protein